MSTTIYITRHSIPMNMYPSIKNDDEFQTKNEKQILSVEGEKRAEKLSELKELQDVDVVISSNYVRAIATAKYVADKNDKDIIIQDDFGERKFGNINSYSELPKDFFERQAKDETYKLPGGESRMEVTERIFNALNYVLNEYKNKKIFIATHGTALSCLFSKIAIVVFTDYKEYKMNLYFNDKLIFDDVRFDAPELFKLEFDENNKLTDLKNVKIKY